MSRIGKQSIAVPGNVKVSVNAATRTVTLTGPKGTNSFSHQPVVKVAFDEPSKSIMCTLDDPTKIDEGNRRALWGTTRSIINKMVAGVASGYSKKLEVVGVGWTAKMQGNKLILSIGFCNPIELAIPATVTLTIENNTNITIAGTDAQQVGLFASLIRSQRKPEPYNGKGIKYSNEFIQRKKGKAFGT